jgi:hypothetical protein
MTALATYSPEYRPHPYPAFSGADFATLKMPQSAPANDVVALSDDEIDAVNGAFGPLAIYAARIGGGAVVGAVAGGVASAIQGDFSWRAVGAGAAAGAIGGAFGGWLKVNNL